MPKRRREISSDRVEKKMRYETILKELRRIQNRIALSSSSEYSSDVEGSDQDNTEKDKTLSGTDDPILIQTQAEVHSPPENLESENEPGRDFEFLGAKPKPLKGTEEPLHEELVVRWSTYLQNGVQKEVRKSIMEKYPLFENCPLLKTPILGPEITSCLDQKALRQDKFISNLQDRTGHALAALGGQINKLLKVDDDNKDALTTLADVSQLISNIHQAISTHRKYNIMPFLNYSSRKLIDSSVTDEFLLGKNFVTELKASQTAKKTSLELKAKPFVKPIPPSVPKFQTVPESRPGPSGHSAGRHLNWKRPQQNVKKRQEPRKEWTENRNHYKPLSKRRH